MSKVEGVAKQLDGIFEDYQKRLNITTDTIYKQTARETAQDLQTVSPKRSGAYARDWTVSKQRGAYIVHNKDHYRLTHLLNNGHSVKNQYGGPYDFKVGDAHIERAEQRAIERLFKKLSEQI